MQLDGSYEFLELTQADGILVSNARERDTGKSVQLHLYPAERSQEANQICQSIMSLPDAARRMIIKFGKDGTSTYFLTEPLPPGQGMTSWIAAQTAQAATPAAAPAVPPPPAPAAKAPPPVDRPSEGPGEFTRMYTQEDLHSAVSKGAPAAAPVPVSAPAPKTPGEFTRMYTAEEVRNLTANFRPAPETRPVSPPVPEPTPAPPPPPARDSAPGLETFIFERSSVTRPAPVISSPSKPPAPPPPPPPPPQPVFTRPEPVAPPVPRTPSRDDTWDAPQPVFAPTPVPQPTPSPAAQRPTLPPAVLPHVAPPRAPAARFDWKIAILLAAGLLIVVAVVIAIVG